MPVKPVNAQQSDQLLYCDHLGAAKDDATDVMSFTVSRPEGAGLVAYLQRRAFFDEARGLMRTYLVRDQKSNEIVGYFSLKAGLVSVNEREESFYDEKTGEERIETAFDTLPGVELANFAVNSSFVEKHKNFKGVGKVIFHQFVLPIVRKTAEDVGVTALYVFALPYDSLIQHYRESFGFERLGEPHEELLHKRMKPLYDRSCVFMFLFL